MTTNTQAQAEALQLNSMKLSALQTRYAEAVGKPSRCPNRTFLVRSILAAMENAPQQAEAEPVKVQVEAEVVDAEPEIDPQIETAVEPNVELTPQPTAEPEIEPAAEPAIDPIMEVSVVPRKQAHREGSTFKVLPVRMENALVEQLDEAWKRQGLRSRMDLFRRALQVFFTNAGETDIAAQFAPEDA